VTRDWFCRNVGRGFPLVLLHGLGASSFSWRENLGPDAVPDFDLTTLTWEILHLLDRHGVARAALVGNSLGGSLALLLARDYPECFPALVLLAPGVAVSRLPRLFSLLRLPLLGAALAALPGPLIARAGLHYAYYRRELITPTVVAGYAPTFRTLANRLAFRRVVRQIDPLPLSQAADLLRHLVQPVCLIWGEQDRILPQKQAVWLKEHLPQAELQVLPGVGHAPQEEAPEVVNEIIIAFLARSLKN
jgi:pimeloyl-ACP methyl ester carboxylesterase